MPTKANEKPIKLAFLRPNFLASNAAGIVALATPVINKVKGRVTSDGSGAILVDKMPPINTITGLVEDINGKAKNKKVILLGSANFL
jgi:hypothetical protein